MKVKPNNYIAIEFPSRSVNEGLARAAVAAFAAQLDPTLDELGDIKTAVSEAVTNAIVHAYPQEIGRIALRASIFDGNLLEITVRDWGCGIADVEKAREPLYTTGGEERSGMGFTIMESFMDSSGIAVVMRALKRMRAMGGSAALRNVPPQAGKVFTAAGVFRIIPLEEGERRNES